MKVSVSPPAALIVRPNAVIASVTMSDVLPRSAPAAVARFITDGSADNIASVFQPAIAMYSRASPDCFAVHSVVLPISIALSVNAWIASASAAIWLSRPAIA